MFSKPASNPPQGAHPPAPAPQPSPAMTPHADPRPAPRARAASVIANDMVLEGNISGAGEIQVDGVVKGDVRVEHVTVGDSGQVEGGIYAEVVEIRGRVTGSVTAKQVRLYGACHVDGDITHEQLAMETGAFFQGRSLRLQRPAAPAPVAPPPRVEPAAPPRDNGAGLAPKPATPATPV